MKTNVFNVIDSRGRYRPFGARILPRAGITYSTLPANPGKSVEQDPKPCDLAPGRMKPRESEVEVRTGADMQIALMTWGSKQKANLAGK